jgi:hypothetical protein
MIDFWERGRLLLMHEKEVMIELESWTFSSEKSVFTRSVLSAMDRYV